MVLKYIPIKKFVMGIVFGVIVLILILNVIFSRQGTVISYAAPDKYIPDSFNLHLGKHNGEQAFIVMNLPNRDFYVPTYFADEDENIELFSIEYAKESLDGEKYIRGEEIDDPGILYILNRPYFYNSLVDKRDYFKSLCVQTAIWDYLHTKYGNINDYQFDDSYPGFLAVMRVAVGGDLSYKGQVLDSSDIDMVISLNLMRTVMLYANEATEAAYDPSWSVTMDSEDITKTDDERYYVTSLFSVLSDSEYNFLGYDILLSGVEGAYIVDEGGNKIDASGLQQDTRFKVVVPIDKIDGVQKLKIEVIGNYNRMVGYYYNPENFEHQRLIGVSNTVHSVINENSVFSLEVVGSPDTGYSLSIYYVVLALILIFIGFMMVYLIVFKNRRFIVAE